jgi:ketosteroid isomerase-like protein
MRPADTAARTSESALRSTDASPRPADRASAPSPPEARDAAVSPRPELPARTIGRSRSTGADRGSDPSSHARVTLRIAAAEWVAAMRFRDVDKLMTLYAPTLAEFEGARDVSRGAVRNDKQRQLAAADVVAANDPGIAMAPSGRTANTRLVLRVSRSDGRSAPTDVVRELGWVLTPTGWRIDRERDVTDVR